MASRTACLAGSGAVPGSIETRAGERTVERPEDVELLLRHEVHDNPPDLLVTNYSMLEYMLLRPIERGIFRQTRQYFEQHPDERLLLILDEAHLYRGAQGTEISMLIRRLRNRLGLPPGDCRPSAPARPSLTPALRLPSRPHSSGRRAPPSRHSPERRSHTQAPRVQAAPRWRASLEDRRPRSLGLPQPGASRPCDPC